MVWRSPFSLERLPAAFAPFFLLHGLLLDLAEAFEADQIPCFLSVGLEILVRPARTIARPANLPEGFFHETGTNGRIQYGIDGGDRAIL